MKTVYDNQMRTQCVPETRMVTKQIPVYRVVPKPVQPCPPEMDCEGSNVMADFNRIDKDGDGQLNYNEVAYDMADANKDGQLSFEEYAATRMQGNLGNTAAPVYHTSAAAQPAAQPTYNP